MSARGLEVRIEAKAYGTHGPERRLVLRDVSFDAQAGEMIALLGRSGVGKSTVLNIALGLDREFEGAVRMPPGRVGVVFQEPRLLPWLSVAGNLRLVCPRLSGAGIAALCDEAMVPDVAALLPSQLSLGMARRVALARALAIEPDILVLDEPFASLDRSVADTLSGRLARRVRSRGMLALVSIHDLDQALALADRILVLAGSPATLAADLPVTADDSGLKARLLGTFPFLGRSEGSSAVAS